MSIIRNRIRRGGGDPFVDDVVLYLKGEGENNGTVFTDSSQYNHTVSRFGGGNQIVTSTAQVKYGTSSLYSPANVVDTGLEIVNSPVFDIAAQNFTLEFWYYKLSNSYLNNITELFTLDGIDYPLAIYDGGAPVIPSLYFGTNSDWLGNIAVATGIPLNTWNHIAFCRKDGWLYGFFNGIKFDEKADTNTIATGGTNPTLLGSSPSAVYGSAHCYMRNFRFTMAGRYSSNFNPETDTYME
jgi:hypothetical protein